jgi:hypothetical protein
MEGKGEDRRGDRRGGRGRKAGPSRPPSSFGIGPPDVLIRPCTHIYITTIYVKYDEIKGNPKISQ